MGGRPLFALNLVGWNTGALSNELLADVLAGGDDIARKAGFAVVGLVASLALPRVAARART